MNLTDALKGWLVEHMQVKETASDEEFREAAAKAIVEGKLTDEEFYQLGTGGAKSTDELTRAITGAVAEGVAPLATEVKTIAAKVADLEKADKADATDDLRKEIEALGKAIEEKAVPEPERKKDSDTTPAKMFGSAETATQADVVPMDKLYSTARKELYHPERGPHGQKSPLAGERAMYGMDHASIGSTPLPPVENALPPIALESPSELDLAISGAYVKMAANAQNLSGRPLPRKWQMTEHDRQLLQHALHNSRWTGIVGRGSHDEVDESPGSRNVVHNAKLTDWQRKALLDDDTSGGTEAAPIEFDAAVITTPVLHGELFPLVSVVPVTRGRRMEGFSIGNPSWTSGTAEGTAISLFDTSSMIAAFDTTIYNAVGAIEIGRDFEEDSPVNIGQLVVQLYGEKAKEWLDNQLANGDGNTEIQGVFNASGITDIGDPAGGANEAPQPTDYLTLAFNVAKQYRPRSDYARCVFVGNDTSYRRARAITVSSTDYRLVFGNDNVSDYQIFDWPYKVQNDIANTYCGFFAMKYYRLYRRLGLTVRVETGGKELARKNQTLIVVRMRWGGKLELGGAGAYSDNWQT